MTMSCVRNLVLSGGLILCLPMGAFTQAAASADIGAIQAAIGNHPQDPWPYIHLAFAEIDANRADEAIAAANHALATPPPSPLWWDQSYAYVYTPACAPGQPCGRRFDSFIHQPAAYYALTTAYALKGDIAGALTQVDAGLKIYPGSPYLLYAKGRLLFSTGQFSQTSEMLSSAFIALTQVKDPNTFRNWGYLPEDLDLDLGWHAGISQYFAGHYDMARATASQLVALRGLGASPIRQNGLWIFNATNKYNKGTIWGRWEFAIDAEAGASNQFGCKPTASPEFYPLQGGRNQALYRIDDQPIGAADSPYTIQHYLKGPVDSVVEIQMNHCPKQKVVRQAVPLSKIAARDFGLLALTLSANGEREQAVAMAQKAVALDPEDFWAELSHGIALEDNNRFDEALKALETPSRGSNLPMAEAVRQIHRAVLYARKGDSAKSQEIYFSVLSHIDPRCLPAVKEKEAFMAMAQPTVNDHLVKAKQLDAQGRYAESLPEYAQALSYAADEQEASTLRVALFAASSRLPTPPELPDDARRHVVRGELLLKQGMLDRALAEFNEALRIAPYIPKLYYNMALIHGQMKQYDRAIRQMGIYLQAAPEAPDTRAARDEITKWELQQELEGSR